MAAKHKFCIYLAAGMLAALMIAAVCIGMRGTPNKSYSAAKTDAVTGISDPVKNFRSVRQSLRSLQKAQLNDVAHAVKADPEIRTMAQKQLLLLCEREEYETNLEGILQIRGWEGAVVTVRENAVNVLLKCEELSQQESSIIFDLVCRETGVNSANVKIIPIK